MPFFLERMNLTESRSNSSGFGIPDTGQEELEDFEVFDFQDLINVIAHTFMTIVGVLFNLISLITAFRVMRRPDTRSKTNVHYLVFQLILADCMVSFIIFPMEAIWRYTIQWHASNALCKMLMMLRTGGFYLSSNLLVILSIDRYISISRPLSALHVTKQRQRSRIMVACAWILAAICSLPQAFIFRKLQYPNKEFYQCLTVDYFRSISSPTVRGNITRLELYGLEPQDWDRIYNFSFNVFVFFIPLLGIVISYTLVHIQMFKRSRNIQTNLDGRQDCRLSQMARKSQMIALKMSIIHTLAFIFCWLPYVIFATWSVIDEASVVKIPPLVRDLLDLSGQFNTCINPLVYAAFYFSHVRVLGKRSEIRHQFISMRSFRVNRVVQMDDSLATSQMVSRGVQV
ncbi:gonadotropin-releasing hormone receptor [Eurytemora carolleeae]|uniref:gonadotropin-releasing hormone receptor n=1 Tax=Eurytemora carolleeae TaxID=1294199 RepID=UPI000C78C473|nr:gonadotropin-releasing hormone receptor [Eurytemora carolleeae]XP_023339763.1 gonadotropin-releasing hormone receptor [Eurytemora carolleeae]XP_023339769.1 gonadotropin-releasing hormone receptor [Eurytemora carolleeae]|eukprot:XP_023339753.1 gonadotropin-releasing hormone receptor-like [Eurytemora affinis]